MALFNIVALLCRVVFIISYKIKKQWYWYFVTFILQYSQNVTFGPCSDYIMIMFICWGSMTIIIESPALVKCMEWWHMARWKNMKFLISHMFCYSRLYSHTHKHTQYTDVPHIVLPISHWGCESWHAHLDHLYRVVNLSPDRPDLAAAHRRHKQLHLHITSSSQSHTHLLSLLFRGLTPPTCLVSSFLLFLLPSLASSLFLSSRAVQTCPASRASLPPSFDSPPASAHTQPVRRLPSQSPAPFPSLCLSHTCWVSEEQLVRVWGAAAGREHARSNRDVKCLKARTGLFLHI